MKPIIAVIAISFLGLGIAYLMRENRTSTTNLSSEIASKVADEAAPQASGLELHCKEASELKEIQICDLLLKGEKNKETLDHFKVTFAEYDLNAKSPIEIIAWESSWAGSSGGRFWVLEIDGKGRFRIQTELPFTCWSPVRVLPTNNKGWRDISLVRAGGGVETEVFKVQFDGKEYKPVDEPFDSESGEVVIGKPWSNSVFGPRPN